jgi:hypothetical protein
VQVLSVEGDVFDRDARGVAVCGRDTKNSPAPLPRRAVRIEVKSGTSADKAQKAFDQAVSYDHPAYAKLNGERIKITSVNYQRVK